MNIKMKMPCCISDVSKMLGVESHVLRYWEEELKLSIERNDMGHRCYHEKDVECFMRIIDLKHKGMQLRAIRDILNKDSIKPDKPDNEISISQLERKIPAVIKDEAMTDKTKRLQYLLGVMITDAVKTAIAEKNNELAEQVKSAVIKELDYQFRQKEESDDEKRTSDFIKQREFMEEHFKKLDDALRLKQMSRAKTKRSFFGKKEKNPGKDAVDAMKSALQQDGLIL